MLVIKNLHAKFEETPIIQGINLTVKAGELHVILGPNGSGKSTFGRVILGDSRYEITNGKIALLKKDVTKMPIDERARAGFFLTFQHPPVLDGVSVKDFCFAAQSAMGGGEKSPFRFKKKLAEMCELLRLGEDFLSREVNKGFSGGESKKLEMVSLLLCNPKLAMLDEIDSGVDVDTVRVLGRGIASFLEDRSRAAVVITHSEKILHEISPSHVHIFCRGKIIRSGGVEIIEKVHREGFDKIVAQGEGMEGFRMIS